MCKKTQQLTVTVTYSNLINYNAPPFLNIVRFHWNHQIPRVHSHGLFVPEPP